MSLLSLILNVSNTTSSAPWYTFLQYTTNDQTVTVSGTATPGDLLQLVITDATGYSRILPTAVFTVPVSGVFSFNNVYLPITNDRTTGGTYVPQSQNKIGVLINVDTVANPAWDTTYNPANSAIYIVRQNILLINNPEFESADNPVIQGDCFISTIWKTAKAGQVNIGTVPVPVYKDALVSDSSDKKISIYRDQTMVAPDGTLGVDIVTRTVSSSTGYIYQELYLDLNLDYTYAIYVKTIPGYAEPALRLGMGSNQRTDVVGVKYNVTESATLKYVAVTPGPTVGSGWRRLGVVTYSYNNPFITKTFLEMAEFAPNVNKNSVTAVMAIDGNAGTRIAIWGLKITAGNDLRITGGFPSALPFNRYTDLITMDSLGSYIDAGVGNVYLPSVDCFTAPSIDRPIPELITDPFTQPLRSFDYNLFRYTDDLTRVEWKAYAGFSGSSLVTIAKRSTPTWNVSSVATEVATKITENSSNQRIEQSVTLKASTSYTLSFFYGQESATSPISTVQGKVYIPSVGNLTLSLGVANNTWKTYSFTFTMPASPATQLCNVGLVFSSLSSAGTANSVFVYGIQLIPGTIATQYVVPWLLTIIPSPINGTTIRIKKDNFGISGAMDGGYYSAGEQNRLIASSNFDGAYLDSSQNVQKHWNTYKANGWITSRETGPFVNKMADVLVKGNPSNSGNFDQIVRGGLVPGRTYCISIYVKTASLPFWDPNKTGFNPDGSTNVYNTSIRINANIAYPVYISATVDSGSIIPNWRVATNLKFINSKGAIIGTGTMAYFKLEDNCPQPRSSWLGTYRIYIFDLSIPTYKRRDIVKIEGYSISDVKLWSMSTLGSITDKEGYLYGSLPTSSIYYQLGTTGYVATSSVWVRKYAFFVANEEMANTGIQFEVLDTGTYGQPVAFYGAELREMDTIDTYITDTYQRWMRIDRLENKSILDNSFVISYATGDITVTTHPSHKQKSSTRIGLNLSGTNYYNTDFMYYDLFKSSRAGKRTWKSQGITLSALNTPIVNNATGWITANSSITWDAGLPLDLDENGWVKSIPAGQWVYALMMRIEGPWWSEYPNPPYPYGDYVCLYEGEGTIDWTSTILLDNSGKPSSNIVRVISAEPGRHVLRLDSTRKGGVLMKISYTNPANYIRNIRFLMPGFEEQSNYDLANNNIPWHPKYIQLWSQFDTFRFMEAQVINASAVRTWDMRALPTDATASRGQSFEHCIDLCNRTDTNAWFCIPHAATENYIRGMAAIIRDTLNKNLTVYIEYSNEWWNSSFLQNYWLGLYGDENNLGDPASAWPPWDKSLESYGYNSQVALDIFLDEFGSFNNRNIDDGPWSSPTKRKRVLTVMSGWRDSLDNNVKMWNYGKKWTKRVDEIPYDCVTTDGYYGVNTGKIDGSKPKELTVDDVVNSSIDYIEKARVALIEQHAQVTDIFKVEHLVYEGGPHFTQVGPYVVGAIDPTEKLLVDATRDPRMKDIVKQHLINWNNLSGNGLFTWFTSSGAYGKFGAFGLTDGANRPIAELLAIPKYAAVIEIAGFNIPAMPTITVINPKATVTIGPSSITTGGIQTDGTANTSNPLFTGSSINELTIDVISTGIGVTGTDGIISTALAISPLTKNLTIGGGGNLNKIQSQ